MASTLLAVAARSAAGPCSTIARAVDALPPVRTNVSSAERWVSLLGGSALLGYGVATRGTCGLVSALAGGFLLYRATTGHCPLSQVAGISTSDSTAENTVVAAGHGTRVDHAVIVMKPIDEVYRFWRDFENLPRFMTHLIDVDTTTDGQSRWTAKGPLGLKVQWEAKLIADEPNRLIAWKSLDGSDVDTAGSVHFRQLPNNRGTEVRVELKYDPPAGKLGTAVAKLFGEEPQQTIREDMRRFQVMMEAGREAALA